VTCFVVSRLPHVAPVFISPILFVPLLASVAPTIFSGSWRDMYRPPPPPILLPCSIFVLPAVLLTRAKPVGRLPDSVFVTADPADYLFFMFVQNLHMGLEVSLSCVLSAYTLRLMRVWRWWIITQGSFLVERCCLPPSFLIQDPFPHLVLTLCPAPPFVALWAWPVQRQNDDRIRIRSDPSCSPIL